ncbi:RagB/SusD family nutrient uptake outer membrane protein [Sphingobacterium gobiense]|uniref:RagB/SusD family nutrient uptake outer membrane protein n=1 Tax=Sphingobacterium gobiense TaxID=1382456 RepID=A0A2S9JLM6_9SPHI|nr:RagB/SusD family nutrient uptake outer membrane protein [Sphingobacterium gobiense]PRD54044.1 RagB/SusD family nutrient uptake outer membrane protein [Sphingobacterium gobiense]
MKTRNILLGVVCAGVLSLNSCDKFLEEDPRSNQRLDSFYQNAAQAQENVNTLYRMGAPVRYGVAASAYIGPSASVPPMLTGYFTNSYEGQELIAQYSRLLSRQENTRIVSNTMNGIWNESYQAINIANGAINYIPEIEMDEALSSRLIGEAKFFRAFNYFYLVKMFGAIPLSTTMYSSLEDNLYLPRTAEEQVYALIEADLKEAVDVLPSSMFVQSGYRLTRYVAAMALANVYLQQGKYEDAADAVQIVIDSPHELTLNEDLAMNSAYNKLRTSDDLPEVIYSYEFDETISHGGWWPTYAFSSSAVSVFGTYAIFERVYGPTNRFLNVYDEQDLRIQPNQFYHWEYTNPNNGQKWSSEVAGVWYYFDETALLTSGRSTKDRNLYRYAEALLIAAEANARTIGVNNVTAGYLAQIKARADINGKTVAEYTSELEGMGVDAFVEEVWKERLRELPLEFKMWDDCLRTQQFPNISASQKGHVTFQPLVGATNASGATFKESDLLWPISMDELQRNPKLTQNPDYQVQ